MSGTVRAGSYRTLLSRPHVARPVLLAASGRLGYAMLPLLLLFTIRDASTSFPAATTAMSAFGLAGLTMPAKARLIDRHGQARVLPLLAAATLAVLETITLLAAVGAAPDHTVWVLLAGAAGVAAPPLGPCMRAQWRVIAPDDTDTAYALDATMEEILWLAGPALTGVLLTMTSPFLGLSIVPVLLAAGSAGLAASPWTPHPQPHDPTAPARPGLSWRGLWPVLAVMALTGAATGLVLTGIAGAADAVGDRGLAAVGEVATGIGAVVGGYAWAHRRPPWRRRTATTAMILTWAGTVAAVTVLGITVPALALLALAGAASAPIWVLAYGAADHVVAETARTEASTWVTTTTNLGSAAGTALTGALTAHHGTTAPLLTAAAIAATTAAVSWTSWTHTG